MYCIKLDIDDADLLIVNRDWTLLQKCTLVVDDIDILVLLTALTPKQRVSTFLYFGNPKMKNVFLQSQ